MKVEMTLEEAFEIVSQRFVEVRNNFASLKEFTDAVVDGIKNLSNEISELKQRVAKLEQAEDERMHQRIDGIE